MGGVKIKWGFNTRLLHFHYFISLEIPPKKPMLLFGIYLGNVNASVVTCQFPQIYIFSLVFRYYQANLGNMCSL